MLCINYNVYILCYVDTMLSTYYYIYILVDTYYVINGITIVKYLHTVKHHNGGNDNYMSPLCALYKWGLLWRYTLPYRAMRRYLYAMQWALGMATPTLLRSTLSRSSIGFGTRLVRAPFASSTKKNMCFPV